ncbi:MAG: DUF4252 domain-containing protein [Bacteroidales bacterium]|nr:DUF4252 domain-containing protein [Bacteroidales bacterium]
MKKIITTAVLLLAAISAFAQTGKSIYNKYSEEKDISAVYISPSMFKLIGRLPDMGGADKDINVTPFVKSLEGFYLLDSENVKVNENIKKDAEKMVSGKNYELLMEAKEDGKTVRFYARPEKEYYTSLVMIAYEEDECTFLCLEGQMLKEDIENSLKNKNASAR